MENQTIKLEETDGYKLAITFKPFIDPKCSQHMEIVKDMGKSINYIITKSRIGWIKYSKINAAAPELLKELIAIRDVLQTHTTQGILMSPSTMLDWELSINNLIKKATE